jgi:FAD/FMN-containing dehydrogenase
VPQGGNTGLVGAQIPDQTGSQLIVSLSRLNKIRNLSADGRTMGVEAGVTLQQINEAAEDADLLFPLSIASRGSCQLGGFLSTNAGGTAVLTYGNARDMVLGLEVVLADGTLWNGLNRLRKNNTGYDLKHLFIGGEGTLGIITAAELKLFDPPQGKSTAFAGMVDIDKVHQLFRAAKSQAGRGLVAFEFIPRIGIEFVLKHGAETRDPLSEPHNWYVLLEITSEQSDQSADEMMQSVLASALENGAIDDAVIAQSEDQSSQFWYVRDIMSEVQRPEGGSIKHDIAVPVAELPTYLPEAMALVRRLVPGCRPVPFGHYGDGNVHFNISQPIGMEKAAFLDHWDEVSHQVHDLTVSVGGTFSAEHGVGALKRASMLKYKDPVELQLMAKIKQTLDPQGILNPGKLLPDQ